jgi:predicted ATP-grasp superfamily ATP-dependent carboligase
MTGAVVTGASYRALAVVRSLGRRGVPVRVVRSDEHGLASASRYAGPRRELPRGGDADRARYLVRMADREGLDGWVLIPTHDDEAALIARNRDLLASRYRVVSPDWQTLRQAYDKRGTHELAASLGLDQPWTIFPSGESDLREAAARFPVVLKPAYKPAANRLTVDKAWRADDASELEARYAEACRLVDPSILMVQQLVPGSGDAQLSFAALCRDGAVAASLTARRTRQYPMDFGRASSFVETIDDAGLEQAARSLLSRLGYTGIIELEFKRHPRSGKALLLDVNPRAWGWQSLCGRAGVDFPYLLWRMANGMPIAAPHAVPGVRWVRMVTDLPAAAGEVLAGRLSPRAYLRSLRRPLEFAVFARDDPLPSLVGPLIATRLVAGRVAGGRPV